MSSIKIALALIVKGTDEEAELLDRCLENVREAEVIDGMFITRTHKKGEKPNTKVKEVAEKYGAVVSDFEWVQDFAKARNFNFSQVPKDFDYILWCDADDVWRGLEKLKDTLTEYPFADALIFEYLYDWDEFKNPTVVHHKTMLIKNDGCATWVGELHEELIENRQLTAFIVPDIDRLHLTTEERAADNAKRNLEIARKQAADNPDDPRSFWNLANSHLGLGEHDKARVAFETFLEESESETEKYLAHMRLADVYRSLDNRSECIKQYQLAIGMNPTLPDAYHQAAHAYYQFGDMDKAEEMALRGLSQKPQTEKMVVHNPRDYDYNPLMLLAKIYHAKNRPHDMLKCLEACLKVYPKDEHLQRLVEEGRQEKAAFAKALEVYVELKDITDLKKLKKRLDALDPEIASHPGICALRNTHFIKEKSSGKDLVIYCGNTSFQWNPKLFKEKGFGGSEEAVIHLAREWARLGWNVHVYNNCGHTSMTEDGVTYHPFWEWNYRDKQDVTILWRWVKPVDVGINTSKLFIDVHDVIPSGEFTEKRLEKIDKIFVKTEFHRSLFPNVPDEKIVVIGNGFDIYKDPSIKKDPKFVINTSSPDRSMDVLPKLWKEVKKQVPDAKLYWAYGWDVYKAAHASDAKKTAWMEQVIKEMDEAGIVQLGKLPQHEIGRLYQEASFLAYPTEFAEIDCISVKKAQAAHCTPVTTDFGALAETNVFGVKVHSPKNKDTWAKPYQFHFGLEGEREQQEWVEAMVKSLKNGHVEDTGIDAWAAGFNWSVIASMWNAYITE